MGLRGSFAAVLLLSAIVHSIRIEFYWTKPSKISKVTLESLLLQELDIYCNSSSSARVRCGLPSSGVLGTDSIVLSDPIKSGINVAVDIDARYTINSTYYLIVDSSVSAMLTEEAVRTRLSNGMGAWIERVESFRYRIKADQQLNIIISICVSVLTLALLVITLLLRKRENDWVEEHKRVQRQSLKKSGDKSYKVRPGPEPTERWPSVRRVKGPDNNKVSPKPALPTSTIFSKAETDIPLLISHTRHIQSPGVNGTTDSSAIPGMSNKLPPLIESDMSRSPSSEHSFKKKSKKKRKQKAEEGREKTTSGKVLKVTELEGEDGTERMDGRKSPVTEVIKDSGVSNEGFKVDESQICN